MKIKKKTRWFCNRPLSPVRKESVQERKPITILQDILIQQGTSSRTVENVSSKSVPYIFFILISSYRVHTFSFPAIDISKIVSNTAIDKLQESCTIL